MMESLRYVSATIISDIQSGHFRPQAGKTGSLLTLAYVGELVQQTNKRGPLAKFLTKKKKKKKPKDACCAISRGDQGTWVLALLSYRL